MKNAPSWEVFSQKARKKQQRSPQGATWRFFLRSLDVECLLGIFVLALYFILVLLSLKTGFYREFIHPRYVYLLRGALPVLAACLLAQFSRLLRGRPSLRPKPGQLLPLLLPVVAVGLLASRLQQPLQKPSPSPRAGQITADQAAQGALLGNPNPLNPGGNLQQDRAEQVPEVEGAAPLDNLQYPLWVLRVLEKPEDWLGRSFTFLGKMEENPAAPPGHVLLGRPVMLCCAADARSIGLWAPKTEALEQARDGWHYFTVKVVDGGEVHEPVLEVLRIQTAPVPQSQYAYYFEGAKLP